MNIENSTKLRNLIKNNSFLPIPSCFDALSAKLIEQTGFDAMFMSGFAASASGPGGCRARTRLKLGSTESHRSAGEPCGVE